MLGNGQQQRLCRRVEELAATILRLHEQSQSATYPHDKERIGREIDATDRQIDQLVYELYGLSEEERRIVKEATA